MAPSQIFARSGDAEFEIVHASSTLEADNLASLALQAATELDRVEREGHSDFTSVRKFADAIAHFSGIDDDAAGGTYWLDPAASEMFHTAVSHVTDRNISNIDTLNLELGSVIQRLRHAAADGPTLHRIKKFCLEVHALILRARSTAGLHERGVFDYDNSCPG